MKTKTRLSYNIVKRAGVSLLTRGITSFLGATYQMKPFRLPFRHNNKEYSSSNNTTSKFYTNKKYLGIPYGRLSGCLSLPESSHGVPLRCFALGLGSLKTI